MGNLKFKFKKCPACGYLITEYMHGMMVEDIDCPKCKSVKISAFEDYEQEQRKELDVKAYPKLFGEIPDWQDE